MPANREELDALLDRLQAALPQMVADNPDSGDFWSEFAGRADVIEDAAGADDCDHVRDRITMMLAGHGLDQSGLE